MHYFLILSVTASCSLLGCNAFVIPKNKRSSSTRRFYFNDYDDPTTPETTAAAAEELEEHWDLEKAASWDLPEGEEKRLAMAQLLGYTPEAAATLSDEAVETETLQWAIDTKVVRSSIDEEEDEGASSGGYCKFDAIADLKIAPSRTTTASLAFFWNTLNDMISEEHLDSVSLVVFPKTIELFDYDVIVTCLQAVQIATPFLPYQLELDLFHPNYKHSPKLWSPETHAPFPTVSIQLKEKTKPKGALAEIEDLDEARSKLKALFDAVDADDSSPNSVVFPSSTSTEDSTSHHDDTGKIVRDCRAAVPDFDGRWSLEHGKEPFQVYACIWELASTMRPGRPTMLISPSLDAHTTQRLAVTVNAAFQKLDLNVRISNVFHAKDSQRWSPHSMIELQASEEEV